MKQSDPIINEMVKSIDYNWDMCNVDLNFIQVDWKKDLQRKLIIKF